MWFGLAEGGQFVGLLIMNVSELMAKVFPLGRGYSLLIKP